LEEEWTKKLESKEEEWKKQMEEKQKDWRRSLELLEKEKSVLEEEKREVVQQKLNLEEALKVADGMLCCFLQFPLVCLNVSKMCGETVLYHMHMKYKAFNKIDFKIFIPCCSCCARKC